MIYIVSLLLCLYLVWMYDILGYTKNKWHWYYLLMAWFIAVSGFQYMVGTDILTYMEEYNEWYDQLRFDVGDIEGKRQPGWVLLCYGCRLITHDFTLLKMIQATFVNVAIFLFFKRESKYVFFCVFLYAITSYLLINFNILRQGFALGFVLYSISYLKRKRYFISAICFIMAYMFHNSALVALVIPLFVLLKYNEKMAFLMVGVTIILIYVIFKIDMNSFLGSILDEKYLGDDISELGNIYVKSDRLGVQDAKMGYVLYAKIFLIVLIVLYYLKKYKDFFIGGFGFLYLLSIAFSSILPIAFRFGSYFEIPFFIILSTVIIEFPQGRLKHIQYLFYVIAIIFYSLFPYRDYSQRYSGSPYRYIDQYYPYHSILEPDVEEEIDHKKIQYFRFI